MAQSTSTGKLQEKSCNVNETVSLELLGRLKGGFYAPDHPNADWSGYVPETKGRKQFWSEEGLSGNKGLRPLAMRDHLTTGATGDYFGPSSDAETKEWKHSGRKISPFYKDSVGMEVSAKTATQWETEAKAAMNQRHTVIEQLTDFGRAIHVRGKKAVTPSFEKDQNYDLLFAKQQKEGFKFDANSFGKENNSSNDSDQEQKFHYDLVGFRAYEAGCVERGKSLIDNLGAQLLEQFKSGSLSLPISEQVDPFEVANRGRRKDLLLENYSNTTPGYTGNRKRNLYI